jgi:ATP-dependent DNA helicase RecG
VSQVELFQLPAPLFESPGGFTRTVLFAHKPLSAMEKADRVRACYLPFWAGARARGGDEPGT